MNDGTALLRTYAEKGSERAFRELVGRYTTFVYSTALRRVDGDTHLAEDIVQIVFADLARRAQSFSGELYLGGWLHRHTCFVARNVSRSQQRRRVRERTAAEHAAISQNSQPALDGISSVIDEAIQKLSAEDATSILLRFFEGRNYRAIGEALGTNDDAAQKRVSRALEKLRHLLRERGLSVTSASLASQLSGLMNPVPLAVAAASAQGAAPALSAVFTSLKAMTLSKSTTTGLAAVLAGLAIAPVALYHKTQQRLKAQETALHEQGIQVSALRRENAALLGRLAAADQEQTAINSEIAQLRRALASRPGVSPPAPPLPENADQKPTGQDKPDFVSAENCSYVGNETPEAALQSFFWAAKNKSVETVAELIRWQRDPEIPESDELDQQFGNGLVKGATLFANDLKGFRITGRENRGDTVRMAVEMPTNEGGTSTATIDLVKEGERWFPLIHVWLQDKDSVRAALEVPKKFQEIESAAGR
ncbi:MAG: sigma-70 family RNA polymerase sigma factor [Verrucomicrobiales bacterium]